MKISLFFVYISILCILAGCGKNDSTANGTNTSALLQGHSLKKSSRILPVERTYQKAFVSAGKAYTNLVYQTDIWRWYQLDKRSVQDIQKELEVDPDNPDLWYALGRCYLERLRNTTEALKAFQRSADLAPDAMMPCIYIGDCLVLQKRPDDASAAFRLAYARAQTEKELQTWAIFLQKHMYTRTRHRLSNPVDTWVIDLLEEAAGSVDSVPQIIAQYYAYSHHPEQALAWIELGMNASTNTVVLKQLAYTLGNITRQSPDNTAAKNLFALLLEKACLSEYERIQLRMSTMSSQSLTGEYPELCYKLAGLSSNVLQRYNALYSLVNLSSYQKKDPELILTIIDRIAGNEKMPPSIANSLAYCLARAGGTNEAVALLRKTISQTTNAFFSAQLFADLLKLDPATDEETVDAFLASNPSNTTLLIQLADRYAEKGWFDREVECRERALNLITIPYQRALQISLLAKRYVQMFDEEALLRLEQSFQGDFTNDAAMTFARLDIYFVKGETNATFEFLCSQCRSTSSPDTLWQLVNKLITTRWPDEYQQAYMPDFVLELTRNMENEMQRKARANILNMLLPHLLKLKRIDDALEAVRLIARENTYINNLQNVIDSIQDPQKAEAFIRELIEIDKPDTQLFNSLAYACEQSRMEELALELYLSALNSDQTDDSMQFNCMQNVLRLARMLGKEDIQQNIVAALLELSRQPDLEAWMMQSIAHTLENNRLTAELEQVLQTYLSSENKEVQSFAIERLVSLYIQNHNASALETLINQWLPEGNLPLDKSFVLLRAYREINKNSQIQSLLDSMRTAFTNNNIIAQWGSSLLSEMRSNGMEESARDLIKQWLDDHELPARTRMQFVSSLHSLGNSEEALTYMEDMLPDLSDRYQRRTILDRLLNQYLSMNDRDNFNRIADVYLNEPDVQSWQLNSLANYFEQAGMYDKALELCERIAMEAEQSGDTSLLNTIHQRKINIFIETGDTRQALQYAEKCMLTDPNNPDSHDLLGRIYEAAGQPDNALQAYCRSLELSPNEHNYMSLISKINNLVLNYDVSFNPDQLAASLLKENRTPQALAAVASLVSHYKPIEELTPYFTEALESELSSNGKQQIYQQWLSLVRENGNQEQELTLLRQYVDVVRYDMKISVQRDISRILLQNGQYEDVVKENTALLDSLPSSPDNAYHIQSIKRDLMNAFVKLGDNDAAWKLANELSDSNNGYDDLIRLGTQLGKTDAVIEKLEKIVGDSSEQNINIYLYLARAYKEHGREDNVKAMVASVEKSLQDAPYNQKRLLLSLYQQLDMPEKTEGLLKEMIGTAPQNEREQVTDQLFNLWRQQNRLDDALDFARTQPETPRLFSMIGELYFAEKDYQNAFDYYRKAYESSGNGQEQWRQDQYQSRLIQAAVQCDDKTIIDDIAYSILEDTRTSSEEQQQRAAQVYQQAGNYEKAADHYMRAVSEAENSDKKRALQQQYATCLNQNKQYDKAIQVYADMLNAPQLPFDTWCYTQRNLMNTYQTADYPNKAQEARRELVNAYERFVRRNPNGRRSGEIKLSLASEYSRAGNTSQACSLYEDIVRAHKGSYAAREAEQRLKSITTKY